MSQKKLVVIVVSVTAYLSQTELYKTLVSLCITDLICQNICLVLYGPAFLFWRGRVTFFSLNVCKPSVR